MSCLFITISRLQTFDFENTLGFTNLCFSFLWITHSFFVRLDFGHINRYSLSFHFVKHLIFVSQKYLEQLNLLPIIITSLWFIFILTQSIEQWNTSSSHVHVTHWFCVDLQELEFTGMFAMTERGHGSNVRGILTEARYNPSTQVILLQDTPHPCTGRSQNLILIQSL